MTPSFVMAGSIEADTAAHYLAGIETTLAISPEAGEEEVAAAVDQAERMCFVLDAIQRPHTVSRTTSGEGLPQARLHRLTAALRS